MLLKKYISLVTVVILSIGSTLLAISGLSYVRNFFIPSYQSCYNLLLDIENFDTKLFSLFIFYLIYFIVYLTLFIKTTIYFVKKTSVQNVYLTIIILSLFNGSLLLGDIYFTFQLKKQSKFWCNDIYKPTCIHHYNSTHHLDSNYSTIPLDEIKTCLMDPKVALH